MHAPTPLGGRLGDRSGGGGAVEAHVEPFFEDIPGRARRRHLERDDGCGREFELELAGHAPDGAGSGGSGHAGSIAVETQPGQPGGRRSGGPAAVALGGDLALALLLVDLADELLAGFDQRPVEIAVGGPGYQEGIAG